MSFQGKENCDFADYLKDSITSLPSENRDLSQALYRAIISRAYYGAFLQTREHFDIRDTSGSVHNAVKTTLTREDRKAGNNLSGLLKLRKDADYQTNLTFSARQSKESTRLASNILTYIETRTTT